MLTFKLAFRTLMKRKGRMALIGILVAFGTFLIVFGGIFASSAAQASRAAIIGNFTGDFIVYSAKSKELPSPFAFNTPLPKIGDAEKVAAALDTFPEIEAYAFYAQNYGIVQVERNGKKLDLPFIFYAVEPKPYQAVFSNVKVEDGSFFGNGLASGQSNGKTEGIKKGILISRYQNEQYLKNYGVTLKVGEAVTLLGVTEGGVNTARSTLLGLFEPLHFKSVFDYINFVDSETYSSLYNFTGVEALPTAFNERLAAASADESSLFALAGDAAFGKLDLGSLKSQALSGFTMVAVKLKDHSKADTVMAKLAKRSDLGVKTARWDVASGFYAQIASALQAFIFLATGLVFLVVTMIFMNTLIINVVERTAEIGTMRAIGADKSFVRGVFLAETLILNVSASLAAMAITAVPLALAGGKGFPLPETVSQFLIGGGPLALKLEVGPFLVAIGIVVLVSILATIYPVSVATSITPLKAMSDR
ncbi:MAG: FtsX-like permease family protein [Treponemataceae bacterium]